MVSEETIMEFVKQSDKEKTTYHFKSSEYNYEIKSKEIYKKEDKFVVFPYYYSKKYKEVRPTFREIRSIVFKGFGHKFPSAGFRKTVKDGGGYGVTEQLKPLFKAIQDNLPVKEIIISKKNKTKLTRYYLVINYSDLEEIRKPIGSVLGNAREKNRVLSNNFLAKHFPLKVKMLDMKYQKGTFNRIITEYDNVEKRISLEDKHALHLLFEKLTFSDKDFFEKQDFLATRIKWEKKYIEDVLKEFKRKLNLQTAHESRWQDFFTSNAWIFSHLFAYPAVLFKDKAYVGGKNISNKEGKFTDYLYKNEFSGNVAFIEIKTNKTPLMYKTPYRGTTVFSVSPHLSGAINQVLDQKSNFKKEFYSLKDKSSEEFTTLNSKCFVIIGKIKSLTKEQMESFELFRHSCKDVEIVTFDELLVKIETMFKLLGSGSENKDNTKK